MVITLCYPISLYVNHQIKDSSHLQLSLRLYRKEQNHLERMWSIPFHLQLNEPTSWSRYSREGHTVVELTKSSLISQTIVSLHYWASWKLLFTDHWMNRTKLNPEWVLDITHLNAKLAHIPQTRSDEWINKRQIFHYSVICLPPSAILYYEHSLRRWIWS